MAGAAESVAALLGRYQRAAFGGAIKDVQPELEKIAKEGGQATTNQLMGDIGSASNILGGILSGIPIVGGILSEIEGKVTGFLNPVKDLERVIGKFPTGIGLGYLFGYAAYQLFQPGLRNFVQDAETLFHSQVIDPTTAAQMAARRIHWEIGYQDEGGRSGMDANRMGALYEDGLNYPAAAEALDMWRRGEIQPSDVELALHRAGMPDAYVAPTMALKRVLISPADLALAVLRGHLKEADAKVYGEKLGITTDDFNTLLYNTGEPPGPQELMEALRRGFINQADFDHGIRQSRIRNEWIPTMHRLRYSPMSIADAVRATVEGYQTVSETALIAHHNGLEPGQIGTLIESWGRPLSHEQMMQLYHRGIVSKAQVDKAFKESDLKNKYQQDAFDLGRRLLPERLIVQAVRYNAMDLKQAATALYHLGYNQADAAVLLKLGLHEARGTSHTLTRAQIVTLYEDHIISKDDAVKHLQGLGYTPKDAEYELTIADAQAHAKTVRAEIAAIRASYLANAITHDQAVTQLASDGIPGLQAQSIIATWDREKRRASRILSESQVVKAAKEGTITPTEAETLLTASGFSSQSATILLKSNGVVFK